MLNILLMIILLIIILIFIILLIGIRITVEWAKTDSEYDGCVKILIFKRLKVLSFDLESDDEDDDDDDDRERDFRKFYELAKPCFEDFKIFLHKLLDAISVNRVENHLVIGFSNFAKTGEYIGYIWAVLSILNTVIPNSRLTAEPSFEGLTLKLKGNANIDISIVKLIRPAFNLLMKKEVRTFIKGVRNG